MKMKKIKNIILPILLIVSISIYPIIFMYCRNIAEVSFNEILPLTVFFLSIGLIILFIHYIALRQKYKSTLLTLLWVIFLFNYMFIQKAFLFINNNLKYWHILPIGVIVIFHIMYVIVKKCREENIKDIINILAIVFSAIIAINYIPVIPKIIAKSNIKQQIVENKEEGGKQSNIYWMIFDECASFSVIEKYYNDSDKTIYSFLESAGFSISDTSRNECGNTHVVLTNCLNLEYIANTQMDNAQLKEFRNNPLLFTILKEQNYTIRGIGDTEWLGVESVNNTGGDEAQTVEGVGIKEVILKNTVIGPFIQYDGTKSAKLILDSLEFMKNKKNYIPNRSQFNLFYVSSPHQPFLFDENGKDVLAANYNNWDDDKYYLGQYKFIMKEIKQIVETILENDPDSIIILESDHGPRFKDEIPYEDKINILNAVYYRGEKIDEIQGKSGVNTLRIIINKLFGYELEELEVKEGE